MQSPKLVEVLHEERAASKLIELAWHQNFDISSEAFSSLRELLLAQKSVSVAYLERNFEEFFRDYNMLLQAEDYVTKRQAVKLLGDILLDGNFGDVMTAYANHEAFL